MFDAVICCNALHNMVNPRRALSEMRRVLRQGGKLIAPTICFGESFKFKFMISIAKLGGIPVFHNFNRKNLSDMIGEFGFTITKKEIMKHPQDKMPVTYIVAE